MLNITLREPDSKLEFDIEKEFNSLEVKGTSLNKALINEIEQANYEDEASFIDRFGYKLYMEYLSTGCKAALLVANTNLNVDLQECGSNAVSAIVRLCNNGNITLIDKGISIPYKYTTKAVDIDVAIDGYHVKDLNTLNQYLMYMVDLDDPQYNAEKIK